MNYFKFGVFFTLFFSCQSDVCVDVSDQKRKGVIGTLNESKISFYGIDYIDTVTDSTVTIHWTHIEGISAYQIYRLEGKAISYLTTVDAPNTYHTLTGLQNSTEYTFKIRALDLNGNIVDSTAELGVTTNASPTPPNSIALNPPSSSPSFNANPTVTVGGVKAGDIVRVFTESNCSNEIGQGTSTGETINIVINTLTNGDYTFYANSSSANTSACSTVNLNYSKSSCPGGYILVPADSMMGVVNDFCVMQFEAKNDGSDNPTSIATTSPWVNINQIDAKAECQSLNTLNGVIDKYDLISNPEWMAISRNIENVDSNWTGGSIGLGCLKKGNIGGAGTCTGGDSGYNAATDPDFGLSRLDNGTAQLILNNGEVIWDLSSNVREFVDWTIGDPLVIVDRSDMPFSSIDGNTVNSWREWTVIDSFPGNITSLETLSATNPVYDSGQGIGQIRGDQAVVGGAAIRGGAYDSTVSTIGIYSLDLEYSSTYTNASIGYRCVYRL